jgi:hypothetical protein
MTHLLHVRNDSQLYDLNSFRLSYYVLVYVLKHSLVHGQEPPEAIRRMLSKLDANRIDNRFVLDLCHTTALCAAARSVLSTKATPEVLRRANALLDEMSELTDNAITFADMYHRSSPGNREFAILPQKLVGTIAIPGHQLNDLASLEILLFPKIWDGHGWIHYASFQIALRDSIIQLRKYTSANRTASPSFAEEVAITEQRNAIHKLSLSVVQSLPYLLGFVELPERNHMCPEQQGIVIRRTTPLAWLDVILRTESTPAEHKPLMKKTLDYVFSTHALEV